MWTYRATVKRVVDGDTIDMSVDLGFRVYTQQRVRLTGVDAPEHYGREASEAGRQATAALQGLLPVGTQVLISTSKTGKYGRWLAVVEIPTDATVVNDWMIEQGHAVPYT